jgi:nitrate reductase NapAB chaperone NapD
MPVAAAVHSKDNKIMPIASVIVEIEEGAEETVLGGIARVPEASVFGIKNNQIVTVIDGKDAGEMESVMRTLAALEKVIGVYPVFSGSYE